MRRGTRIEESKWNLREFLPDSSVFLVEYEARTFTVSKRIGNLKVVKS